MLSFRKNILFVNLLWTSVALSACGAQTECFDSNNAIGGWALHPPQGGAAWLGVTNYSSGLKVSVMWRWGSVLPVDAVNVNNQSLILTRNHVVEKKPLGLISAHLTNVETMIIDFDHNSLKGNSVTTNADGTVEQFNFTGERLPRLNMPNPYLFKFGEKITLFNGTNLSGWKPVETNAQNGWHVENGLLINSHSENHVGISYANLQTEREFEDFDLRAEVRVSQNGNSGIYLRGIYEVQVYDTFGKPLDSHNMGAIYSRVCPTASAEKPAGEWQNLHIMLVQRHVSITLNGVKIIDNQPVAGPTGGALWSEVDRPGPIMLQGDHTSVEYRNLVLRPLLKN